MNIYTRTGTIAGNVVPIDVNPTENSSNSVQSGGVYNSIKNEPDKSIETASKNLIVKANVVKGTINTTSGDIDSSDDYYVSEYIPVDLEKVYISYGCDKFGAYQADKTFISVVNINTTIYATQNLQIPANTKYIRIRIPSANIDDAICADVRYYTPGVTSGVVSTGFSEDVLKSAKGGIKQFADENPDLMVNSGNLFDWRNDFVQVNSVNALQNDGSFRYLNNNITKDEDLVSSTYISLDKYFPISQGEMIVCNYYTTNIVFYNSQKTLISNVQIRYGYRAVSAPENAAYVRISIQGSSNQSASADIIKSLAEIKNIIVFKVTKIGENDLIPKHEYLKETKQIDGGFISPNYLDKVVPSMNESQFLSAMRCMAIREMNKRDHAWRFANLNMWIMANTKGWDTTKKMLMDYGVDFCGFEECVINESSNRYKGIAEFLHGWQFPSGFYTNWTDGEEQQIDKSFVSRFSVTQSTKLNFTSTQSNASYLNCRVTLPRYMDVINPRRTLSVYIVHFAITSQEIKIAIANELLQQIATDDSDFVVILGDTNDFGSTDETKDYWVTLEAGGFRPVLPISSKTITYDISDEQDAEKFIHKNAIDQFLISDNIDVVSYGVVNTKDEYGVSGVTVEDDPCLSDHDFVYCDLKFNYDTPRTIIPVDDE